jgi:spermidine/putrescine transport system permease protein
MVMIIYYGLTNAGGNFTFENILNAGKYSEIFLRSVFFAIFSTFLCFLLGYPSAFTISRLNAKWQKIAVIAIILPMWINFLLIAYAIMTILEANGPLSSFFALLGLPKTSLVNTKFAVIFGMVYNSISYMILPIYSSLSKIDGGIMQAARDLGANEFQIFARITFPLSVPGIISGFVMVFGPLASTFVISKMLGGSSNILMGELIELKFLGGTYSPNSGSALALILVMFIIMLTNLVIMISKN